MTAGCDVVHYTGHGVRGALTFELEGRAELDVCTEETLGRLVAAGGHRTKVVFLAACDSERPGKALARMGIPHVVCVRAGARLSDRTARSFAEQFYDALCRGKTVREAFDVATAVDEKGAYLLLPAGACYKHDTVICDDSSEESQGAQIETPRLCPVRGPAPPERLAGRNDAVAEVVRLIGFERRRCVTVRGARGVGKTAVARAAAAFLADRGNLDVVCEVALGDVQTNASYEDYFGLSPARRDDAVQRRIERRLVTVLADALEALAGSPRPVTARRVQDRTAITESPDALVKALASSDRRCLLVADGVQLRGAVRQPALPADVHRAGQPNRVRVAQPGLRVDMPVCVHDAARQLQLLAAVRRAGEPIGVRVFQPHVHVGVPERHQGRVQEVGLPDGKLRGVFSRAVPRRRRGVRGQL